MLVPDGVKQFQDRSGLCLQALLQRQFLVLRRLQLILGGLVPAQLLHVFLEPALALADSTLSCLIQPFFQPLNSLHGAWQFQCRHIECMHVQFLERVSVHSVNSHMQICRKHQTFETTINQKKFKCLMVSGGCQLSMTFTQRKAVMPLVMLLMSVCT